MVPLDEKRGRVVLLSDGLWRNRFGADSGIVGKDILLDGRSYTVLAVMPSGFNFPDRGQLWVPFQVDPAQESHGNRQYAGAIGRLKAGVTFELKLPSVAFHRHIGEFKDIEASPDGRLLSREEWAKSKDQWLPSSDDGAFIASLMQPCWERGKFANWIAPPKVGIDNKPGDFEYVKIHRA